MQSKQRLNANVVNRLPAPSGLTYKNGKNAGKPMPGIVWDTELKGFGVMVSATTKAKTYVVRLSIKGQNKRPRIALGRTTELTFEQARVKAVKYLARGNEGIDPEQELKQRQLAGRTLRQVMEKHVAECRERGKPRARTIDQLEDNTTRHLAPWLDLPLRSITSALAEQRFYEIPKEVKAAGRKGADGRVVANHALRALRLLWRVAVIDDETLPRCPVDVLSRKKLWHKEKRRNDHIAPHQMEAFWGAVDKEQPIQADIIKFILLTALREKNALSLRWDQVDFAARAIRYQGEQMKSGRDYEFPMPDYLFRLLERRKAMHDATEDWKDTVPWVWAKRFTKDGVTTVQHYKELRKPVDRCRRAAGVAKLCAHHGLRRTFATLGNRVVAEDIIGRLMDHRVSASVTSGYIHTDLDRLREPMQKVTDEILLLAGINITDAEKLPKDAAALEAAYVRRFGAVTFDAAKAGPDKSAEYMREGLLRMKPVTDLELARRAKQAA
ncbi:MAG: integrase family protein [Rhodospirillaceae bacterium]|nr:integrase family protein [Rhodospirillaceae bacterium]